MPGDRYATRKLAQGYQSPLDRPACRNCAHRGQPAPCRGGGSAVAYDCRLGRFLVSPGGICPRHEIRPVARFGQQEVK